MASGEGLNLFQQPTYDTSIVSRADTEYYPSDMTPDNNKESIIIEVINKSETDFIDLNSTEILADLQICDTTDNSVINTTMAAAEYGICNNFGQALFKQITLQEGDIEMNNSTGTYPYQVDFENRVTYDERDLEGRPRLEGCIPDTASLTALARTHATQATQNAGLFVRSALFDNGKHVQVIVKPHLGPLAQTRYLLPKTRITFKLIPNSDSFLLSHDPTAAKKTYGVYIKRIKLRVRTVKLEPQRAATIYRTLQKSPAVYPTPTPVMSTALIYNGVESFEKDNIFSGKVPKLLMFAIVKNSAFNGSVTENPFYYLHLNIKENRVLIDGVPLFPAVKTDFGNRSYKEAFLHILNALDGKSSLLNAESWDKQMLWVFDLTPKGRGALSEFYPVRSGNLRLELKFKDALAGGPYTIIFYGLMDSTSQIDANNNVIKNW